MATKKPNALEALLNANPDVQDSVYIKRLDVDFIVKALDQDVFEQAQEEATYNGELQQKELNNLIIARSCVEPNFDDAALLKLYGAAEASDCVNKSLKVGEIAKIVEKIMDISGFDTNLEQAKK